VGSSPDGGAKFTCNILNFRLIFISMNKILSFIAGLVMLVSTCVAANINTNQPYAVILSWDASSSGVLVSGYNVYVSTNSFYVGTNMVLNPVLVVPVKDVGNNLTTIINNLVTGITYHFVVTAYNSDRFESLYSIEAMFTKTNSPLPPFNLTVTLKQ
jgi:hypothetical protein